VGLEWLWGSLVAFAFAVLGTLFHRSAKSIAEDAVKPVKEKVIDIELDLAKNFVRRDDEVMKDIQRSNRKLLRMFGELQIQLARKFGFSVVEQREGDEDED